MPCRELSTPTTRHVGLSAAGAPKFHELTDWGVTSGFDRGALIGIDKEPRVVAVERRRKLAALRSFEGLG